MKPTLYVFPISPRAFKTLLVANHLGVDFTLHALKPGESATPEFGKLNINNRMPVLKDGDYVLWESNAILEYLSGLKPEAGLMPTDIKSRLQVSKWLYWDMAHWDQATSIFVWECHVKKAFNIGEASESEIARAAAMMTRLSAVLEKQLQANRFVAGDHLTLADFAISAPLIYAEKASLPLDGLSAIARWRGEMEALPAWSQTTALQATPAAA